MTREEAKHIVDVAFIVSLSVRRAGEDRTYYQDEISEAKNMAIQALSQEPCDDTVSRQAVIEAVSEGCQEWRGIYGRCEELINALPSVTHKSGKWIPVSERLPEEEIDVLVCNSNGEIEISAGTYSTEANDFMWYTSGWRFGKVTAWMPLPKPYEPTDKWQVMGGHCTMCGTRFIV